jgi:hypothetical protein
MTISMDGTMPTKDGHKADLQREHGPADARHGGRHAKHKNLVVGHVVAGETDAILLVAHGDEDAAELAGQHKARQEHGAKQQDAADEIEDIFRAVGPDVPAQQRT